MRSCVRIMVFVSATIFFSVAHADDFVRGILFGNKTRAAVTLSPRDTNGCVENPDMSPFTVDASTFRTYAIKIKSGCTDASIGFDYSQSFDAERKINGKVTYRQFQQDGKWLARLNIKLTPPIPTPQIAIFRTSCGYKNLMCSESAVALTSNEVFARFFILPTMGTVLYGRDFMHIGK